MIPETVRLGTAAVIYFSIDARHNFFRLRFQLAHEAIHFLSGALRRDSLKFEEGLAVHFSLTLRRRDAHYDAETQRKLPPMFDECLQLYRALGAKDEQIRSLRLATPNLDKIDRSKIMEFFSADSTLAEKLCERVPFDMTHRL